MAQQDSPMADAELSLDNKRFLDCQAVLEDVSTEWNFENFRLRVAFTKTGKEVWMTVLPDPRKHSDNSYELKALFFDGEESMTRIITAEIDPKLRVAVSGNDDWEEKIKGIWLDSFEQDLQDHALEDKLALDRLKGRDSSDLSPDHIDAVKESLASIGRKLQGFAEYFQILLDEGIKAMSARYGATCGCLDDFIPPDDGEQYLMYRLSRSITKDDREELDFRMLYNFLSPIAKVKSDLLKTAVQIKRYAGSITSDCRYSSSSDQQMRFRFRTGLEIKEESQGILEKSLLPMQRTLTTHVEALRADQAMVWPSTLKTARLGSASEKERLVEDLLLGAQAPTGGYSDNDWDRYVERFRGIRSLIPELLLPSFSRLHENLESFSITISQLQDLAR